MTILKERLRDSLTRSLTRLHDRWHRTARHLPVLQRSPHQLVRAVCKGPLPLLLEHLMLRLYEAHAADQVPYIEILADYRGDLCVTQEIATRERSG